VPEVSVLLVLLPVAFVASIVSGVAGFGAGVLLLPFIAWTAGIKATAPVLTVAMLVGNIGRIWWSRGEIDRRVVWRYLLGAVPGTAIGALLYAGATTESLGRVIGVFLIAAVPLRRLLVTTHVRVRLAHFPFLGLVFGALSSVVVTTGPITTPFFLSYGLRRGAFIATEATASLAIHLTRGAAFARLHVLTWDWTVLGLSLGAVMFVGTWVARRILERMSDRVFLGAIETLLVVMGLHFLFVSR
jgi:uncharacterized membrane protein YfcA